MTNNKQSQAQLRDAFMREVRYYCESEEIDTAIGFDFAKSFTKDLDLVSHYEALGEDAYTDWVSDTINNYFTDAEEEEEGSVSTMTRNELAGLALTNLLNQLDKEQPNTDNFIITVTKNMGVVDEVMTYAKYQYGLVQDNLLHKEPTWMEEFSSCHQELIQLETFITKRVPGKELLPTLDKEAVVNCNFKINR